MFRFDPRNASWLQVAGMLERRTRFHVDVMSDHILAVGGGTLLGNLTNTMESYQPAENKWQFMAPCPMPVADHAGTTHKGILYISGERQLRHLGQCLDSSVRETHMEHPTESAPSALMYSVMLLFTWGAILQRRLKTGIQVNSHCTCCQSRAKTISSSGLRTISSNASVQYPTHGGSNIYRDHLGTFNN